MEKETPAMAMERGSQPSEESSVPEIAEEEQIDVQEIPAIEDIEEEK